MPSGQLSLKLPKPHWSGGLTLETCISRRRSVRGFSDQALAANQIGLLLWAAQGVTGAEGERAAPSAGALYPLEVYLAVEHVVDLGPGVYRYLPARHEMLLLQADGRREELVGATGGQGWIATASAIICIAAAFDRTTSKYGHRGRGYVYIEAGHAAQSLMLEAVALGLATTMVGAFDDGAVTRILCLPDDETPLCLIPVGAPSS